jgi:hypothetical protein
VVEPTLAKRPYRASVKAFAFVEFRKQSTPWGWNDKASFWFVRCVPPTRRQMLWVCADEPIPRHEFAEHGVEIEVSEEPSKVDTGERNNMPASDRGK